MVVTVADATSLEASVANAANRDAVAAVGAHVLGRRKRNKYPYIHVATFAAAAPGRLGGAVLQFVRLAALGEIASRASAIAPLHLRVASLLQRAAADEIIAAGPRAMPAGETSSVVRCGATVVAPQLEGDASPPSEWFVFCAGFALCFHAIFVLR